MAAFDGLLRETLMIVGLLCLPVLAIATFVGTLIAIVQAATQIQEQTITLLPKMLVVGAFIAVFGAFGMRLCAGLFGDALRAMPALVRGL